jgi:hypothetical protein
MILLQKREGTRWESVNVATMEGGMWQPAEVHECGGYYPSSAPMFETFDESEHWIAKVNRIEIVLAFLNDQEGKVLEVDSCLKNWQDAIDSFMILCSEL